MVAAVDARVLARVEILVFRLRQVVALHGGIVGR
jgi:hypothetical protein